MSFGRRTLKLWVAGAAVLAAVAIVMMARLADPRSKPTDAYTAVAGVLFVNETSDHKYDRALRGSIRIFQERTQIQLGIILKEALPQYSSIETYAPSCWPNRPLHGEIF